MSGALGAEVRDLFDALGLPFRIGRLRLIGGGRLAGRRLRRGIVLRLFDDLLDLLGDDGLGGRGLLRCRRRRRLRRRRRGLRGGCRCLGGRRGCLSRRCRCLSGRRCRCLGRRCGCLSAGGAGVSAEGAGVSAEGAGVLSAGGAGVSAGGAGGAASAGFSAGAAGGVAAAGSGRGTGVSAFVRRKAIMAARFLSSATPGKAIAVPAAKACGFFSQASSFSYVQSPSCAFSAGV